MDKLIIEAVLSLAFEAGKWVGQVELEEHFDREQFAAAALECIVAQKTSMPSHPPSTGKTVTINLRSENWRAGVRKSADEYLEKAKNILINHLQTAQKRA